MDARLQLFDLSAAAPCPTWTISMDSLAFLKQRIKDEAPLILDGGLATELEAQGVCLLVRDAPGQVGRMSPIKIQTGLLPRRSKTHKGFVLVWYCCRPQHIILSKYKTETRVPAVPDVFS